MIASFFQNNYAFKHANEVNSPKSATVYRRFVSQFEQDNTKRVVIFYNGGVNNPVSLCTHNTAIDDVARVLTNK